MTATGAGPRVGPLGGPVGSDGSGVAPVFRRDSTVDPGGDIPEENLHILTGAPGTGKTAILEHRMFALLDTVGEPAREILAENRRPGHRGGFDGRPEEFQRLILERSIAKHRLAMTRDSTAVFDRGVPDCIAYARHAGVDPGPSIEAAAVYRYSPTVFLTPPWQGIYRTDFDRIMTFEMTVEFHERILEAYDLAGYDIVEVPPAPIDERARFVVDRLALDDDQLTRRL